MNSDPGKTAWVVSALVMQKLRGGNFLVCLGRLGAGLTLALAWSRESISCLSWAHLQLQARCKEKKKATTSPRTTAG